MSLPCDPCFVLSLNYLELYEGVAIMFRSVDMKRRSLYPDFQ